MFTAATVAAPFAPCVAIPPATASPPPDRANSRASRTIVASSIPIAWATALGRCAPSTLTSRLASAGTRARCWLMMTCAIASASVPSVPGRAAIHSSAFMPVSDRRGPTYTNLAIDAGLPRARQEDDSLPPGFAHFGREPQQRPVPIDSFERPAGVPHERMGDAIGVVESLQRRLAARAQPAAIDRRVGIAFELDRPSLAHAHPHPASRGAFAAGGGVIRRGPRYLVFGLHQIRDQPLGGLGADAARCHGGCTGAGDAEDLQEASATHRVSHISNGTRCSRGSRCSSRGS